MSEGQPQYVQQVYQQQAQHQQQYVQPVYQQQAQQPVVILPVQQAQNDRVILLPGPTQNYNTCGQQHVIVRQREEDTCCLYCCAVISIFIPIVGLIAMCCYGCGNNLGPLRKRAFRFLIICTIIGLLVSFCVGYFG
eukprot:357629_1